MIGENGVSVGVAVGAVGAVGAPQQSRKERTKVQSWYFYNWVNYFVISTCLRGRAHLLYHPGPDHLLHKEKTHFPLGVEVGLG